MSATHSILAWFVAVFIYSSPAIAVRKGVPSKINSVVMIYTGNGPGASGVLLSESVAITVGHLIPPGERTPGLSFTFAEDARRPNSIPNALKGGFIQAARSPEIDMGGRNRDSLVLLLIDPKDRSKLSHVRFPQLPGPGHVLFTPTKSGFEPKTVTAVGYGKTGREDSTQLPVVSMRNQGTLKVATWAPQFPNFPTMGGPTDQYPRAMDSGSAIFDGEVLVGITSLISGPDLPLDSIEPGGMTSIHFWLGEPSTKAWIESTLKGWSGK